jgi:hypothetical protein
MERPMNICPQCRKEVVLLRDGKFSIYGKWFHASCVVRYMMKYYPTSIRGDS